jgi:dolichol-phosphate mannosyltransferase
VLVDDGSKDETPNYLDKLQSSDPNLLVIQFSRNFGHQAAVTAGIDHADGDAVIVMDGDLQDPPEVLSEFIAMWERGYDVVYAVRSKRKEAWPKRLAYYSFYRILRAISDIEIPLDSGDFCLMDRRVVAAMRALPEKVRFVRGLRTFVGFRQIGLQYERAGRAAGTPKYTFRKLLGLAADGLVSFSSYPLRLVTYCGFLTAILAVMLTVWVIWDAYSNSATPRGWASTIAVVLFVGSIQLVSIGILGEYVRTIFIESKNRPSYVVSIIRGRRPEN